MVLGPTDFQDLLQCVHINTFHLIKIENELFFVNVPALLTFVAVVMVSVYALKLQIRLSREIQPQVNLPPEGIIPSSTRDVESSNKVKNSRTSNKITLGAQSSGPNWDDIQIVDLENSEEIRAPERIRTNRNGNEEEQESSFSIKRKNSDPNKFFRVPKETTSVLRRERTGLLMAQLLVRMLRRRDDRLSSLGSVLARLTHLLSSLTHLGLAVSLLTKDIAETDSVLVRTQLRRQADIWTLLSAAVSHRPASDLGLVEQEIELNKVVIQENMEAREVREAREED